MIGRLFSFLAVVGVAVAQNQCTSFVSLVHTTTGAPSGLAIPDCSYIQANSATICNSLGAWDIINANTCYLKGPGYGCNIVNGQFSTSETFYCQVGPAPTSTSTFSPIATSTTTVSPSGLPSASQQATLTPSASQQATLTPSASGLPSVSSEPTLSGSASPSLSVSPQSTQTSSPSSLSSSTSTLTTTPSTTPTMTPFPSMNHTVVFVYTTVKDTSIGAGQAAAIGLSTIFGFCLLGACGYMIRKRPAVVIQRQLTITERRPSKVAERRASKVAEPTTPKVVIRTVV